MEIPEKVDFQFCLVPKFKLTTVCLISQLADFAIGGVFASPKISQFREVTVVTARCAHVHLKRKERE